MFTCKLEGVLAYNINCCIETEGLLKVKAVMFFVEVVISWKQCKTETFYYTTVYAYRIKPHLMTLSDI